MGALPALPARYGVVGSYVVDRDAIDDDTGCAIPICSCSTSAWAERICEAINEYEGYSE
jgi:hypothetical protein